MSEAIPRMPWEKDPTVVFDGAAPPPPPKSTMPVTTESTWSPSGNGPHAQAITAATILHMTPLVRAVRREVEYATGGERGQRLSSDGQACERSPA